MKNKLIQIGVMCDYRCYLNVDREEAIKRYCISENITFHYFDINVSIHEIEFEDEFGAYDIYE